MATAGMKLIVPTSIGNSGGTATLGSSGRITLSGVTTLNVNGCFTSAYDNYVASLYCSVATDSNFGRCRMRSSGSDISTSTYQVGYINVNATQYTSGSSASQTSFIFNYLSTTQPNGMQLFFYGPNLAQATVFRGITADGDNAVRMYEGYGFHTTATGYDGFTYYHGGTGTMTGYMTIYGFNQ